MLTVCSIQVVHCRVVPHNGHARTVRASIILNTVTAVGIVPIIPMKRAAERCKEAATSKLDGVACRT